MTYIKTQVRSSQHGIGKISHGDRNGFLKRVVSMFISAVKFGILQWVLMTIDFFLQPAGVTPAGLLVECSFIALPHWLHFSEQEARSIFYVQSMSFTK